MQKSNTRTPWVFYVGVVVLCCFLISTHFTGGLYAKYSTTAYGEDSARVAKFYANSNIAERAMVESIDLSFFDESKLSCSFGFIVESNSEVDVGYDVIVTMPHEVSSYDWLEVTISLDGGVTKPATTRVANVFTFEDVAQISTNDTTPVANVLMFSIKSGFEGKPPTGLTNIADEAHITVRMSQID